jgi:SAM-dependent methyltransferase
MDAVLEHVHDPVQVLRKVNEVLRPDGVIAVKVPKLDGPAHRLHGREWNGFRIGFHTYLFTGRTLTRALNRAGFDVLNRPKRDRPLDDLLLLWGRKRHQAGADLVGKAA